jgi:hypothetical protein
MKTPVALAIALSLVLSAGPALAGSTGGQRSVFQTHQDPWRHWGSSHTGQGNHHFVGHPGFAGHPGFVGHQGFVGHRHHGLHHFHGHGHQHFTGHDGQGFIHTPQGTVIVGPRAVVPKAHGHVLAPAPTHRVFVPGHWGWWANRGWVWVPGHWAW